MTAAEPSDEFAPAGWSPPTSLVAARFRLVPLGPEHNESDHAAWGGSIDHIRATPGFRPGEGHDSWPEPMSSESNLADLEMHAREFRERTAFTFTVLAPETDVDRVIGCVYMYPDRDGDAVAVVRCWVSASVAELDQPLAEAVRDWIAHDWPWASVRFPGRFAA